MYTYTKRQDLLASALISQFSEKVGMKTEGGAVLSNGAWKLNSFAGQTESAVPTFSGLIARFVVGLAAALP
jgi:hypothetical protein